MSAKTTKNSTRQYGKKALMAGFVMLAACITLIFFGPFEALAFAGNAIQYNHQDVWLPLALMTLGVFALGTFLLPLLRGKAFRYTVTVIFALTLCGYLQSVLMNGSLGLLDGHTLKIPAGTVIFNTALWLALIVGCLAVQQLSRVAWRYLLRFGSLLLVVVQLASVVSIAFGNHPNPNRMERLCLTDQGMYEYSQEKNIFVFVLDRLDQSYIQTVLKEEPDLLEPMDGFIQYTNAISAYARTQPALNHILTGCESAYFTSKADYFASSWQEDGKQLLEDLDKLGYDTEMYTNIRYLFSDPDYALSRIKNAAQTTKLNIGVVLPKLLQLGAFRWSPLVAKPLSLADTNYYNKGVFSAESADTYEFDDCYYFPGFREATAERSRGSFKFYHFFGSHAPYSMKADGTASEEATTMTEQTIGCFRHLQQAFEQMKALGIYKDATIIITGDHGDAYRDSMPLQRATTLGLFYKPSGSAGTPLTTSSAPVCTDNICATIMKQAGLADYSAYGSALDDIPEDADIPRYYYKTVCEKTTWHEVTVCKYEVRGDARKFENWVLIETIEALPEDNRFY